MRIPNNFLLTVINDEGNQQLQNIFYILFIRETDYPSTTSELRYFSALDSSMFKF
jgi:hypothetical protein